MDPITAICNVAIAAIDLWKTYIEKMTAEQFAANLEPFQKAMTFWQGIIDAIKPKA